MGALWESGPVADNLFSYSRFWRSENSPYWMQRKMLQMSHLPIFTILKHLKMCWSWIPWKCKLFAKSEYCLSFVSDWSFEPIKVIFLFHINPLHYFRGAIITTSLFIFFRKKNGLFFPFFLEFDSFYLCSSARFLGTCFKCLNIKSKTSDD